MSEIVNIEMAAAWDGDEGDDWTVNEQRHNDSVRAHSERLMTAAAVARRRARPRPRLRHRRDHARGGAGGGRRRSPRHRSRREDARPQRAARGGAGHHERRVRAGRRPGAPVHSRVVRRGHQPHGRHVLCRSGRRVHEPRTGDATGRAHGAADVAALAGNEWVSSVRDAFRWVARSRPRRAVRRDPSGSPIPITCGRHSKRRDGATSSSTTCRCRSGSVPTPTTRTDSSPEWASCGVWCRTSTPTSAAPASTVARDDLDAHDTGTDAGVVFGSSAWIIHAARRP